MAQIVSDRAQGRKKRHASKVCEGTVGCRIWQWISVCFMLAKWRGHERTSKSAKGQGAIHCQSPNSWVHPRAGGIWWVWLNFDESCGFSGVSHSLAFWGNLRVWAFKVLKIIEKCLVLSMFRAYAPDRDIHRVWVGSNWKIHWRLGCSPRVLFREKNLRLLQCLLSRQVMTAQHSAQKSRLGMPHQSQSLIKFCLGRSLWGTGWFAGVLWPFMCWYMFRSKVLNNSHRL